MMYVLHYVLIGLATFTFVSWFFKDTRKIMEKHIVDAAIVFLLLWPVAWIAVLLTVIIAFCEKLQKRS